jgi:hypothetical protein
MREGRAGTTLSVSQAVSYDGIVLRVSDGVGSRVGIVCCVLCCES